MVISDQFAKKSMAAALQQAQAVAGGAQIQVLAIMYPNRDFWEKLKKEANVTAKFV